MRGIARSMGCQLATAEQLQEVASAGNPQFARLVHAVRICGLRASSVAKVQIADVDFAAAVIRRSGRRPQISITEELAAILRAAISERTEGPAFLTKKRGPWTRQQANKSFREARRKAGLPDGVIF